MTDRVTAIRAVLTPIVESLGLSVDLDELEIATRTVSAALDAMDPVHGRYLLEVSSPGLERPLRTADHFAGAIGEIVTCKTRDDDGHAARLRGVLAAADADSIPITTDPGD